MTTYTIFGAADGVVQSSSTTYTTARSGANLTTSSDPSFVGMGQRLSGSTFIIYEFFTTYDCSVIDAGETVSSAFLNLYNLEDHTTTDFVGQARDKTWGTIDTGDWVAGASLGALTLLGAATFDTGAQYETFTDVAMTALVDVKAAATDMMVSSAEQEANSENTNDEYCFIAGIATAGTANDPFLDVTAAAAAGNAPTATIYGPLFGPLGGPV